MILGSTYKHETGRVILYSSKDGENWSYLSQCRMKNYGYVIECPDMFEVDGQRIFTGCPVTPVRCGDKIEYEAVSVIVLPILIQKPEGWSWRITTR